MFGQLCETEFVSLKTVNFLLDSSEKQGFKAEINQ